MATAVQIKLTLDNNGVLSGLQQTSKEIRNVGDSAEQSGKKAAEGFRGIEAAEQRAHIAGKLVSQTLGVELPRSLERVMSHSQVLGPLMAGLFNLSIFAAAGAAILGIAEKIAEATTAGERHRQEWIEVNATVQDTGAKIIEQLDKEKEKYIEITQGPIAAMEFAIQHMRSTALAAFADIASEAAKAAKTFYDQGSMFTVAGRESKAASEDIKRTMADMNQAMHAAAAQNSQDLLAPFVAEQKVLDAAIADTRKKLEEASKPTIVSSRFSGTETVAPDQAQIVALKQELTLYEQINTQLGNQVETQKQTAKNSEAELQAKKQDEAKKVADKAIQEAHRVFEARSKIEEETQAMYEKGVQAQLSGDDAIYNEQQVMVDKARGLLMRTLADEKTTTAERIDAQKLYDTTVVAADQIAQAKIRASHEASAQKDAQDLAQRTALVERASEDMKVAQENAALAVVPEWQRGTAQLQIELNRRLRAIQDEETKALAVNKLGDDAAAAIKQDAQAKRLEAWLQTDQRIREEQKKLAQQLGSEMESVFNDIGSGKIGQTILNNAKKLFFQILAQWLLTTKMMGSGFGSIFGSLIFGPGSTGAGVFGGGAGAAGGLGGAGMLGSLFGLGVASPAGVGIPGAGGTVPFFGGSTGAAAGFGGGGALGGLFGGSTTAVTPAGATSLGTSTLTGAAASALTTSSISSALGAGGVGTSSGALAAPKLGASLGGLFNMNSLLGLGGTLTGLLGGKLGGGAGQVGGMLTALSVMAALNPGGVAAGLLANLGGIGGSLFAAAGPALLAFGIGTKLGPLGGALAGAGAGFGAGALIGFAGGPIGALLGGIIGAIAGLFGGLFGGSQRKKQANNYFDQQIGPAIKQIVASYEGFSLDYASATGQLEQLKQQAQDQLKKLKGEGKSVFAHKVEPAITAAEQQIGKDEKERTRRMGLVFGPPQFHTGGYVQAQAAAAYTTTPGEMLALVKNGEFVVNPQATARHRGTLEAMNNGGSPGLSVGAINITTSVLDRKYVTSTQFAQDVLTAIRTATNQGLQ